MTQAELPLWQKALPVLALAPAAAIANGSLISRLIVAVTPRQAIRLNAARSSGMVVIRRHSP